MFLEPEDDEYDSYGVWKGEKNDGSGLFIFLIFLVILAFMWFV